MVSNPLLEAANSVDPLIGGLNGKRAYTGVGLGTSARDPAQFDNYGLGRGPNFVP